MAVVTEKPKGRIISLLSKNKLIAVRNKKRKTITERIVGSAVIFDVKNTSTRNIKFGPFNVSVKGTAINKPEREVVLQNTSKKMPGLEVLIPKKKLQKININPLITSIKLSSDVVASSINTNFKPIDFIVEDIRSFGSAASGGNGGNVDKIELTMQQQSFYEINVKYKASDIAQVNNLPVGLILEKGKIKGAPIYAGVYIVEIILINGEKNYITINVSQLPRTL